MKKNLSSLLFIFVLGIETPILASVFFTPPFFEPKYHTDGQPCLLIDLDIPATKSGLNITDILSVNRASADTTYEMETINVLVKHNFLAHVIDSVFTYSLLKNPQYQDYEDDLLLYFVLLPDRKNPKIVWSEIADSVALSMKSYSMEAYIKHILEESGLGMHDQKPAAKLPPISQTAIILKKGGKYFKSSNELFSSYVLTQNFIFFNPFQKGRKLNFGDKLLKRVTLDSLLKNAQNGGFSSRFPQYTPNPNILSGCFFLEDYDKTQNIFHFYRYFLPMFSCAEQNLADYRASVRNASLSYDMPIYCGPTDFWANPSIGFISFDFPILKYDLGLHTQFVCKAINGLSWKEYLKQSKF